MCEASVLTRTMAVKQHVTEAVEEKQIDDLSKQIENLSRHPESLPSGQALIQLFEEVVQTLALVKIPNDTTLLKPLKDEMNNLKNCLSIIYKNKPEQQEDILYSCLPVLYQLVSSPEEPSGAVFIILEVFDKSIIARIAHECILESSYANSDDAIKQGLLVACRWLSKISFAPSLHLWIIGIFDCLRKKYKYDLLLEVSLKVIVNLFQILFLPILQAQVAPVVICILSSTRHTPVVFHKILNEIPRVVKRLKETPNAPPNQNYVQQIIDVLSALINHFPGYGDLYREAEKCLSNFKPSFDYRSSLDSPLWNDSSHAPLVSTNARVGLVNLGNTCYMNSVLQALVMTKQFSREILLSNSPAPLLMKIQQLLALLLHSARPDVTPRAVLHAARPPGFQPGHQQDSSEFLGHLLETLHEQEKHIITNRHSDDTEMIDISGTTAAVRNCGALNMSAVISESPPTLIQTTFGGKIAIVYECLGCGMKSRNTDSFRDLQLAFPGADTPNDRTQNYSVQDLLDFYCATEKLNGDNQYFCDRCKTLCDAERSIDIVAAPRNLVLTVKHFQYDQLCHTRAKLMHKVYHDEEITLKQKTSSLAGVEVDMNLVKYVLYAAVVHSGVSMDSGHYYTFGADTPNCWYKFNDNYVTKSSLSELHDLAPPNSPYILFYQRLADDADPVKMLANAAAAAVVNTVDDTIANTFDLPCFDELPVHLREFVNHDNLSYREQVVSQKKLAAAKAAFNRNSRNDDEPPRGGGGGGGFGGNGDGGGAGGGGGGCIEFNNHYIC